MATRCFARRGQRKRCRGEGWSCVLGEAKSQLRAVGGTVPRVQAPCANPAISLCRLHLAERSLVSTRQKAAGLNARRLRMGARVAEGVLQVVLRGYDGGTRPSSRRRRGAVSILRRSLPQNYSARKVAPPPSQPALSSPTSPGSLYHVNQTSFALSSRKQRVLLQRHTSHDCRRITFSTPQFQANPLPSADKLASVAIICTGALLPFAMPKLPTNVLPFESPSQAANH